MAGSLSADERVDRVLLVAPPSAAVLASHPEVAEFARVPQDAAALVRAARSTRLAAADDDPYCPGGAATVFAGLGLDTDVLPGAAHLDLDAGYGRWPAVEAWCRDPATRLVPRG